MSKSRQLETRQGPIEGNIMLIIPIICNILIICISSVICIIPVICIIFIICIIPVIYIILIIRWLQGGQESTQIRFTASQARMTSLAGTSRQCSIPLRCFGNEELFNLRNQHASLEIIVGIIEGIIRNN